MSTVFVDVDTQIDFLYAAGALYAPGAERIVARVAALNRYAAANAIPVISTMDAHTEDDPEFRIWPPHCVAGTAGQQKPASTLLEKRIVVPNAARMPDTAGAQQILIEKQSVDCFTNPNLIPLLDRLEADHCVVYGVVTEVCVRNMVLGLLKPGRRVEVVTDAICEFDSAAGSQTITDFTAARVKLSTSDYLTQCGAT